MSVMHPCARCATIQRTCCQRAEVVVTVGDVARLRGHTGDDGFTEFRLPPDPSYLDGGDDPAWVRGTVELDGRRRVLRRRAGGNCIFLGAAGCTLPGDARPLVCRLYPYTYTERGIDGVDGEYCPVAAIVPPGFTLLTVLGMRLDDAQRWHRMLYHELRTRTVWGENGQGEMIDESRADLRPAV